MILLCMLILNAIVVGVFTGSLLTEAVILVPYWRSMKPEQFLELHSTMGPRLYQYFKPLTITATLVPVITAVASILLGALPNPYAVACALLVLSILCIYFVYFKAANTSFATGSVGVDGLPAELRRWSTWHWIRTAMSLVAFLCAVLAIHALG